MMKGSWFSPEVGTHRQINPYLVNSSSPEELEPLLAADHHDRVRRGRVLRRQVEVVLGYLRRSWQNAEKPPSVGDALELVVARNLEVRREPATRSFTVWETRTSDGPAFGATRAPIETVIPAFTQACGLVQAT